MTTRVSSLTAAPRPRRGQRELGSDICPIYGMALEPMRPTHVVGLCHHDRHMAAADGVVTRASVIVAAGQTFPSHSA